MLINWLKALLKNTIYVKITSKLLSVSLVEQDCTFEDKPLIALAPGRKGKQTIIAVGSQAETAFPGGNSSVSICNGFDHPRSCVRDFEIAAATLRYFIRRVVNRKAIIRPVVIMHPLEKIEGGLTQFEYRGLCDLAVQAGAWRTYVWTGRILESQELTGLRFPDTGGKLGWG